MGTSVQVRGVKKVLQAFEDSECDGWAVIAGREIAAKGVGSDRLSQCLEMFRSSGSDAVYSLRMYEGIEDRSDITLKTEPTMCIGFKLSDEPQMSSGSFEYTRRLEERLKKLEEGDEHEDKSIGGKIGNALLGLLEQPKELIQIIGMFRGQSAPQMMPAPASIGRVPSNFSPPLYSQPMPAQQQQPAPVVPLNTPKTETMPEKEISQDEKLRRVAAAFDVLEANDPKVLEHLEKLAKISTDEPKTFKMLLTTLDAF